MHSCESVCNDCGGKGTFVEPQNKCDCCKGRGTIETKLNKTLEIPKNFDHNTIMLLKNLGVSVGLCNGSRGRVIGFDEEDQPRVKFCNGMEVTINEESWDFEIEKGKDKIKRVIKVKQHPLKLAYAISIHKSQGMTLDCVEVDLKDVFECGQAYTALSRVRTLEGLRIKNFDANYIQVHPKVVSFYNGK